MSTTSVGPVLPNNGLQPSAQVQADFFAKLARLEKAVLTQQHPRYVLPQVEVERLASALDNTSFSSPRQQKLDAVPNGIAAHHAATSTAKPSLPSLPSPRGSGPREQAQKAVHARPTSSSIDPVLLTKSDDLVKAEMNLKRIRIEKTLKESVNSSKKDTAKERELGQYLGPITFDTALVFDSAMSLVKPQSGLRSSAANENSSASPSSDEMSYYSSQVNSWTHSPEDKASASSQLHTTTTLEPRVSGLGPRDNAENAQRADKLPQSNLQRTDASDSSGNSRVFMRDVEDLREESYSPPGITDEDPIASVPQVAHQSTQQSLPSEHQVSRMPYSSTRTRESESYSPPPPPQVPALQNLIAGNAEPSITRTSSIALGQVSHHVPNRNNTQKAPQQSQGNTKQDRRKSKNQKAKDAKNSQNILDQGTRKVSGQQPISTARKRRREAEHGDDFRRVSGQRAAASPSPVPYIKQEPVSPPLTGRSAVEPPRRLVLRDDGRADIEVMSPRHNLQRPGPHREEFAYPSRGVPMNGSRPASRQYNHEPIVIDESDDPSTVIRRRPTRVDSDLRRVASMQYAAQPYSPVAYTPQRHIDDHQYARPISRTVADRPFSSHYQYHDEPDAHGAFQHRLQERRSSPIFVGDDYLTPVSRTSFQPPPKRRIVVDQYGNEYIAVPARSRVDYPVVREMPEYQEPLSPYRNQTIRQQTIQPDTRLIGNRQPAPQQPQVIELDDDEEDYRRMPPPQLIPRKRQVDMHDERLVQPTYYAPRSASLQPLPSANETRHQYMPSQSHAWNVDDGRQPSVRDRAYSARPNLAQQEEYYTPTAHFRPLNGGGAWR